MTMALINYPAYDHLDEKTRQMLDRTRNEQGRIASFTHMMSKNPAESADVERFYAEKMSA